uniref:Uncharacterized protein n=1 Tax=Heterorhabditis bacteriophora TaxID=37862 RepID=A0A1I7W8N5_HETBA
MLSTIAENPHPSMGGAILG